MIVDDPNDEFKAKRPKPNWIDVAMISTIVAIFALVILYGHMVE